MKSMFFILLLVNSLFAVDTFKSEEAKIKEVMLDIAKKSGNKDFIEESKNLHLKLNKDYKKQANTAFDLKEYNIKKICETNNIDRETCMKKFIEEIETQDMYGEFRNDDITLRGKPKHRSFIENLYKKYPNEKEYIRANFDQEGASLLDYYYVFGKKKEDLKVIINYIFLFGVFLFLIMIGRDFKSKKTKKGALLYITTITSLYLALYFFI